MRVLILLGTVLSLGCGGLTDPLVDVESEFVYGWAPASPAEIDFTASPTVRRLGDGIEVTGSILLGNPCHTLSVRSVQARAALIIAVQATDSGGPCLTVLSGQTYRVRSALPEGVSRVIVQHSFAGVRASAVVVRDTTLQAQ